MRLLRMVRSLLLAAILSVILASTFGCRHNIPTVTYVAPPASAAVVEPLLRKGQNFNLERRNWHGLQHCLDRGFDPLQG